MRATVRFAPPLMAALLLSALLGANAQTPPEWAIGRFVCDNGYVKADAEVVITHRGDATLTYRYPSGRVVVQEGRYRRDRLVFASASYYLSRTGRGIKLVDTRDRENWMGLDRARRAPILHDDGWRHNPPRDRGDEWEDRAPDWAVGTFVGDNGYLHMDAEITIRRDGWAVLVYRTNRGRLERTEGRYERGRLAFGRTTYELSRTGRGIKVTNTRDRRDWMGLDRSDRGLEPRRPR
jgi:hypothetical protein